VRRSILLVVAMLWLGACASAAPSSDSYARDRITKEDITATLALNTCDAVRLLRRRWLVGNRLTIYENGTFINQEYTSFLRMLRSDHVVEIRFLDPLIARTVYGYNVRGAVLEVDTVVR
jgi:hypothetical protein